MTFIYSASIITTSSADVFFQWKNFMVSRSYVVVSSSDGTTLSAGDIITSPNTLTASLAYFILKQPLAATSSYGGSRREWGVQHGSVNNQNFYRISYTVSGSHTGSGNATTIPNGSDRRWAHERIDLTFTWQTGQTGSIFPTNLTTHRFHFAADDSPPFGWYILCINTASAVTTGGLEGALVFDPMISGTFHPSDPEPYVSYFINSNQQPLRIVDNMYNFNSVSVNGAKGWVGKGLLQESYQKILIPQMVMYSGSTQINVSGTMASDGFTGGDNTYPIFYYAVLSDRGGSFSFAGQPAGLKGYSSLLRGLTSNQNRRAGDTYSTTGSRDFIVAGDFALPWNGSDPGV